MSEKSVKEVNNLISASRYEDALSAVRRQNSKERSCDSLIKEAYILLSMEMLKQCGDFCLEQLEKEKSYEFSLILKACENRYRRRSLLLLPISDYQPAETELINGSITSLMAVFCDIPEARAYVEGMMSRSTDSVYRYLMGQLQRLSGNIPEAIDIIKALPSTPIYSDLLNTLKTEKGIFEKRAGKTSGAKQELEEMNLLSGEQLMVRGFWSIAEKDSISAFKYFGEAVKSDPSMAIGWYYVGVLQSVLGAKDRGEQCFNKFLELFPQSPGFFRNQIENLAPGTERGRVEDYYHRWIGYMPADPASWLAYLKYLLINKDASSVILLASEILDNYSKNWFTSTESSFYYISLGILKMYVGRFSAAEESFRTALKYNGAKSLALLCLGRLAEINGIAADAIDNYEKASIDVNTQCLPKYLIANTFIKKKNFKKAMSLIEEVLAQYPRSPLACLKKAEIYFEQPDIKLLRKYLSELKNDQLSPEISILTSMIALRDSNINDAILELEKAYRLYPDSHLILKNLSILYFKSEQYAKSIALIDTAHVKPIDMELMLLKAHALLLKGEHQPSFELLCDTLSLEPFNAWAWHLLGICSFHLEKKELAFEAFEKSAVCSGGKIYNRINLAAVYALKGQYSEAIQLLEVPSYANYTSDSNYFILLGWLQFALGKKKEALETVQKLLKTKKSCYSVFILKASIEYADKDYKAALKTITEGINECGANRILLYNKAYLMLLNKEYDDATKEIDNALTLDPDFYQAWLAKAVINWLKSDEEGAMAALKGAKKLKHPSFKEWLKNASSLKDPLESISFYDKIDFNYYFPEIFTMHYDDPLNVFLFENLDGVFKKQK